MTQYRIEVRQTAADLSAADDRRKNPQGTYFCDAASQAGALEHFHSNVAIGCLDDFAITAALVKPFQCPDCQRLFASETDLQKHAHSKRRTSAAHGLDKDGRPRRRK